MAEEFAPVRRRDRAVSEFADCMEILRRCDTIHLGVDGGAYPYVVPLSFGCEVQEGAAVLYVHGAPAGKKHALLAKNPRVCVQAELLHGYAERGGSLFARYESVTGFGTAQAVQGDEALRGLALLCAHCGYENFPLEERALQALTVYKITLCHLSGKRCAL